MNMYKQLGLASLIIGSSSILAQPTKAANLDLTAWQAFGDVQIVNNGQQANLSTNYFLFGDDFGIGEDDEFNFSGLPAADIFALEAGLGLPPGGLDPDPDNFIAASEGSALQQTLLDIRAGDKLSFEWNFLTNETSPLIYASLPDYAFFLVNGTVIRLAGIGDTNQPASVYDSETGFGSYDYTFTSNGQYTIAFGVVDVDDFINSSALSIRNLTLTRTAETKTTPEPSAMLGLLVWGAMGLGFLRRGERKKVGE
jgi:hypothetical protein